MIWPARGRDAISLLASVDALSYPTAPRKSRMLRGGRSRCGVGGPPLARHPGIAMWAPVGLEGLVEGTGIGQGGAGSTSGVGQSDRGVSGRPPVAANEGTARE